MSRARSEVVVMVAAMAATAVAVRTARRALERLAWVLRQECLAAVNIGRERVGRWWDFRNVVEGKVGW
jgi:hypothetical protein